MPRRCCVTACNSNYSGTEYVTVFRFPADEILKTKWTRSIPRENFVPTKDSVVCIKHFAQEFLVLEEKMLQPDGSIKLVPRASPRLTDGAYPSVFPNLPSYLSSEPLKKRRAPDDRRSEMAFRDDQAFTDWMDGDIITSFDSLKTGCIHHLTDNWITKQSDSCLHMCLIDFSDTPSLKVTISVNVDLQVTVFCDGVRLNSNSLSWILAPTQLLDRWSKFDSIISHLENSYSKLRDDAKMQFALCLLQELCDDDECDSRLTLQFLTEQLNILMMSRKLYSARTLLWACRLFLYSSKAYEFVRKTNLALPHQSYLRRLTSCLSSAPRYGAHINNGQFQYLKNKAKQLEPHQLLVNLMLDEIHVEPCSSFKGGSIVGFAMNEPTKKATTVQAFMISSILSKDKEVVELVPVVNLAAPFLHKLTVDILKLVHEAGYQVISILSDNNRVNRNTFTMMCDGVLKPYIAHPCDPLLKLFFLFDSVHLVKCIRNNWLNQFDSRQTLTFPDHDNSTLIRRASFYDLKLLHDMDDGRVVKLAPNLTRKALFPSNTERQKVSLALKIFDEKTISALQICSSLSDSVEDTKYFITVILKVWKIFNVKDPVKGIKLRDNDCMPIRSVDDERLAYLTKIALWMDKWREMKQKNRQGCLTQETHFALHHTIVSMKLLVEYLLSELKFQYVLLGKFQTDNLEFRFSQYRQLSGGNYHISVRQIIESEKKLKLLSVLHLKSARCGDFSLIKFMADCNDSVDGMSSSTISDEFSSVIGDCLNGEVDDHDLPSIVFIAGYIAHKVTKNNTCTLCKYELCTDREFLCDVDDHMPDRFQYIDILDRGGLKWLTKFLVDIVSDVYVVFKCLISDKYVQKFLAQPKQREVVVHLANDFINPIDRICECGMLLSKLIHKSIFTAANVMLNNYTKTINDTKKVDKATQKQRKLAMLTAK